MMLRLIYIGRIFKTGLKNFFRNGWLSVAATTVMLITLFTISIFTIINIALNQAIANVRERIDVSIFLNDTIDPTQLKQIEKHILTLDQVKSLHYTSKQEALAKYKADNKDNPTLIQAVTENPDAIPASLEVKGKNPDKVDTLITYINSAEVKPFIHTYTYKGKKEEFIKKLVGVTNTAKQVSLTLSGIFVLTSLLVIFNTIRIAIFTRREEIGIMKLVGATSNFIRYPFIIEGAMYGIIGTAISVGISYPLIIGNAPSLERYLQIPGLLDTFRANLLAIVGVQLLVGVLIGIVSSFVAIRRYLKIETAG